MFQGKRPAFSMMAVCLLLFFTGCADTEESVYGSGIRTEEIDRKYSDGCSVRYVWF